MVQRGVLPGRVVLVVLVGLLAACAAATPSAQTSDVVAQLPLADGEAYVYTLHNDVGELIGRGIFEAEAASDGRLLLRQSYQEADPPEGVVPTSDVVTVIVDGETLRPLSGTREIVTRDADGVIDDESFAWSYAVVGAGDDARVRVTSKHSRGDDVTERGFDVRDHYYDNETSLWLWRTLDFAEEYDEFYVSVNPIEGSQQTVNVRVPLRQELEVPAGRFDTWRILLRNGRAVRTAWINAAPPHQVVQWDNGVVVFRLEGSVEDLD